MPSPLQSSFLTFHKAIKLGNTDENATLREKRDAVLRRLRDRGLTFTYFNQGSYAMGTGVKPTNLDYDIDFGLVLTKPQATDPLAFKGLVYDAVLGHTPQVEWRRHCVRVQYVRQGQEAFHVDLAVYREVDTWTGKKLQLAAGRQHSGPDNKAWRDSDPKGLVQHITNAYQD